MTRAFDMSRYQRIVGTAETRVSGSFVVSLDPRKGHEGECTVEPLDVTIYDEGHNFGRIIRSKEFIAWVRNGEVDIPKHMIASDKLADIEEAWGDVVEAILAVANVEWK